MQKYKRLKYRGKKISKTSCIVMLSLFIAIGYALVSTSLTTTGTLGFKQSWNFYMDNISVKDGSVASTTPSLTNNGNDYSISYTLELSKLEDYYEFEVDLINDGLIDAEIYSITSEITPTKLSKYYNYQITYANGSTINVKDKILANSSKRIKIRLEFNNSNDVNLADIIGKNYLNENRTINLSSNITIRQAS